VFFFNSFYFFNYFKYLTIILKAMQVGLGTTKLPQSKMFQQSSYECAVFSIVLPLLVVAMGLLLFFRFFIFHLIATQSFLRT